MDGVKDRLRLVACACLVAACPSGDDGTDDETGADTAAAESTAADEVGSTGSDAESSDGDTTSGDDITAGDDTTSGDDTTASDDAGTTGEPAGDFDISFDYRFDRMMAVDQAQQTVLDAAAATWEVHILSEFDDVPAGTALRTRHPEAPFDPGMVFMVEYDIDDVVIVTGYGDLDGMAAILALTSHSFTNQVTDAMLLEQLNERFYGPAFQPWVAVTTFDPAEPWFVDPSPDSSDDIPGDEMDMMSVATHEIGHALGVGTSDAFNNLVDSDAETFLGPVAMEVYGGPVPLAPDLVHIRGDVLSEGVEPVMAFGTALGTRKAPTPLDLAVLEDIGYITTP